MLKKIIFLPLLTLVSFTSSAQSRPSAEGGAATVWAGAQISTFNPDYGCGDNSPFRCFRFQLLGIAPYVDANALILHRVGAEAETRFLVWRGPSSLHEFNYLAGPRVAAWKYRNLSLNGKFLVGVGNINIGGSGLGSGTYLAYAPGVDLEYHLKRRLSARLDYEYQIWPSFKGNGSGTGGLTPNGFSVGLSYAILHR